MSERVIATSGAVLLWCATGAAVWLDKPWYVGVLLFFLGVCCVPDNKNGAQP